MDDSHEPRTIAVRMTCVCSTFTVRSIHGEQMRLAVNVHVRVTQGTSEVRASQIVRLSYGIFETFLARLSLKSARRSSYDQL